VAVAVAILCVWVYYKSTLGVVILDVYMLTYCYALCYSNYCFRKTSFSMIFMIEKPSQSLITTIFINFEDEILIRRGECNTPIKTIVFIKRVFPKENGLIKLG
jgi:hypothetical protein